MLIYQVGSNKHHFFGQPRVLFVVSFAGKKIAKNENQIIVSLMSAQTSPLPSPRARPNANPQTTDASLQFRPVTFSFFLFPGAFCFFFAEISSLFFSRTNAVVGRPKIYPPAEHWLPVAHWPDIREDSKQNSPAFFRNALFEFRRSEKVEVRQEKPP